MAKPRRRKTTAIQTFTVITIHSRPPDAEARLARAKGLPWLSIWWRHAVPNAMIPVSYTHLTLPTSDLV